MDQIELEAAPREILGKKVRFLRRQGITPANLYGRGVESISLQCDTAKLIRVLVQAGQTKLIELKLSHEKRPRTVMVREMQREPGMGALLHVDFYQVQMAERVKVEVPIVLVGEAPALKSKENTLIHELNTLSVECLPAKIPANIELDLSVLTEPDQAIRVKDVELDEEVAVLNDPELVLVRISSRPLEKAEEVVAEAVEAPEAAPPTAEKPKEQ